MRTHRQRPEVGYSLGRLVGRTGLNLETIRYYERIGLMPAPPRPRAGHRVYDLNHVKRLGFIRRSRELGFSIEEIRTLRHLVDGGTYTCAEVREITLEHLKEVQRKIADLRRLDRSLKEMAGKCTGESVPECPIVDVLWRDGGGQD